MSWRGVGTSSRVVGKDFGFASPSRYLHGPGRDVIGTS